MILVGPFVIVTSMFGPGVLHVRYPQPCDENAAARLSHGIINAGLTVHPEWRAMADNLRWEDIR